MRKKGHKVIKMNKLTLPYCGNIDDLNICYRLKLRLPFSPLEIAFNKNIATNDDYINKYCVPIQSVFTEKYIKWYLYNKTSDMREFEELWINYFRYIFFRFVFLFNCKTQIKSYECFQNI